MKTTGPASRLALEADRDSIAADGRDLSFVTLTVTDNDGLMVPRAKNAVRFSLEGPGEIVATDNGDPTSFESFQSPERKAFNGLALVIVRGRSGQAGRITVSAQSAGLEPARVTIRTRAAE
jgi:beta-galactosidase